MSDPNAKYIPETGEMKFDKEAENAHPLECTWSVWFVRRQQGQRTAESYEKALRRVATFNTVEAFWACYNHLSRPTSWAPSTDCYIFRWPIPPMWENEANKVGGKWMLRLRKGLAAYYWESLVLAALGEQFDVGDEICGVGISTRYSEDVLSIWTRNAGDDEAKKRVYDTLSSVLQLNQHVSMEYKAHDQSFRKPHQESTSSKTDMSAKSRDAFATAFGHKSGGAQRWTDAEGNET